MAKPLGQIHTVNYELQNVAAGDFGLIDLPGQLSARLQHPVRMMSTFKVVGIDIAIVGHGVGAVTGDLKYYAPTEGRVKALQQAWKAMKDMLDLKGIKYWNNLNYDFRPPMGDPANFLMTGALGSDFGNQASIESVGGAPGALCLTDGPGGYKTVFETYNENISPGLAAAPSFSTGFRVIEAGTAGDMVLNEEDYLISRVPVANVDPEVIPFQLSLDTTDDIASSTFMWRPDPALYLSVLTGQFAVFCELSSEANIDLDLSIHVSGWTSILGDKHRRRRRSSKKGGKKHGRKRRSKK